MENKKLLKEAYQILIPIANKILFDTETPPTKEENGFKLSDDFISSHKDYQKSKYHIIKRNIITVANTIFKFDIEDKRKILMIVSDNLPHLQIAFLMNPKSHQLDPSQIFETILGDYIIDNQSEILITSLNYHFVLMYENEFKNGYISENEYIKTIKMISQRTSFI